MAHVESGTKSEERIFRRVELNQLLPHRQVLFTNPQQLHSLPKVGGVEGGGWVRGAAFFYSLEFLS